MNRNLIENLNSTPRNTNMELTYSEAHHGIYLFQNTCLIV